MIPIYNIVLGQDDGLLKMSLVYEPAVESNFIALNKKEKQPILFSTDDEKREVFGCSIRADYPIYRFDRQIGEYYIVFSKEVIKQLSLQGLKDNTFNKIDLQHSKDTEGVYLMESFIKDVNNGINPKGFEDVEDGSLFSRYKVENEEVWQAIKSGELKGFSIEAFLSYEDEQPSEEMEIMNLLNAIEDKLKQKIKS